jgi:hypothetical protein
MTESGFCPRVSIAVGAEQMIDAIVSGLVPDPESIFYRNAKWLKELTQIGTRNHKDIIELMEKHAAVHPVAR